MTDDVARAESRLAEARAASSAAGRDLNAARSQALAVETAMLAEAEKVRHIFADIGITLASIVRGGRP